MTFPTSLILKLVSLIISPDDDINIFQGVLTMSSYTQFETVSKSILRCVTFSVTNEITRMLSTDVVHFVLNIKDFVSNGLKNWRKAGWSCSSRDESFRLRRIVLVSRLATSSKAIRAQGQSVVSVLKVPYDRRKEKERNSS